MHPPHPRSRVLPKFFNAALLILAASAASAGTVPGNPDFGPLHTVTDRYDVPSMPMAHGPNDIEVHQPVCEQAAPAGGEAAEAAECPTYPVLVFSHADYGGGIIETITYRPFFSQLASRGFVVVAPRGCWMGCGSDQVSLFRIAYEALQKGLLGDTRADLSRPVVVMGHSTGGRNVLEELANPQAAEFGLTLAGGIGMNPDHLPSPAAHVSLPLAIFTGDDDWLEPKNSAWKNYSACPAAHRFLFVEWHGIGHINMVGGAGRYAVYAAAVARVMARTGSPAQLAAARAMLRDRSDPGYICGALPVTRCELDAAAAAAAAVVPRESVSGSGDKEVVL